MDCMYADFLCVHRTITKMALYIDSMHNLEKFSAVNCNIFYANTLFSIKHVRMFCLLINITSSFNNSKWPET